MTETHVTAPLTRQDLLVEQNRKLTDAALLGRFTADFATYVSEEFAVEPQTFSAYLLKKLLDPTFPPQPYRHIFEPEGVEIWDRYENTCALKKVVLERMVQANVSQQRSDGR